MRWEGERLLWRRLHRPYHDLALKWRILSARNASMLSIIRRLFWSKVFSRFGKDQTLDNTPRWQRSPSGTTLIDQCLAFILIKLRILLTNLRTFCKYFLLFKIFYFSVSNFCFISNTHLLLNITIKLNEKMRKITRNILVISYIFIMI